MSQLVHCFDLVRLRGFVTVAEAGSITLAAQRLGVAQPALSASIKRLEQDLGVALFDRLPRGMRLSHHGRALLPQVYDVFGRLEAMRVSLAEITTEPSGDISIGLPPSASVVLTQPLLRRLREAFPKVQLRLVEAMSGYLYDWVEAGELDVAITFNGSDTETVRSCPMFQEEMMLIGAVSEMERLPVPFPIERIPELPLIVTSARHTLRSNLENQIEARGLKLNIRLEIDAGHQLVRMVSAGEGFGIFAQSAFATELSQGDVRAISLNPRYQRIVCLTYHRRKHFDWIHQAIRSQLEFLISELRQSNEWPATSCAG